MNAEGKAHLVKFHWKPLLGVHSLAWTESLRLGGPNFHELPINSSVAPVHNHQRDGFMRHTINTGRTNYQPNSLGGGCPFQAGKMPPGFMSYAERIDGQKIRERSESFRDHFSQATLF